MSDTEDAIDEARFEKAMEESRIKQQYLPSAVAYMEGSFRDNTVTYTAEVSVYGAHRIIKTGFKERAEAEACAQKYVDKIMEAYKRVGLAIIDMFPVAKE